MSNLAVRKRYNFHNKQIPEIIDKSISLKEQAIQACELRNKYKFQAREPMHNQTERKKHDAEKPIKNLEYYYEKYRKIYNSYEDVFYAIIYSSTRTNKIVNQKLGLEE